MVGVKSFLRFGYILFFSLSVLFVGRSARASTPTPIIGYLSADGVASLAKNEEFGALIEKRTGIKVKTYSAVSNADLVEKMATGKIDFAFLSSLAFVELEQKTSVKVLLKKVWEQGYYYSVLLTKKSSSIRRVADLKGKRIAFVDEKSASGSLYPQALLGELGLNLKTDFKSVVFSGAHEKSVELLRKGEVDVIAVFANDKTARDSAWTHAGGKAADARVVWASAAIPNDPLCVRNEFYEKNPKATHDLMFGLVEMNEDPVAGLELKRTLGVQGLMMATAQQYEPVRKIFKLLKKKVGTP
jgi:phosphonate transport system substrate-binding protein